MRTQVYGKTGENPALARNREQGLLGPKCHCGIILREGGFQGNDLRAGRPAWGQGNRLRG